MPDQRTLSPPLPCHRSAWMNDARTGGRHRLGGMGWIVGLTQCSPAQPRSFRAVCSISQTRPEMLQPHPFLLRRAANASHQSGFEHGVAPAAADTATRSFRALHGPMLESRNTVAATGKGSGGPYQA
ncbi:hypothetical protein BP6252_00839 [Coleophoma cylindrospora]|uniref:Uncharacterized protein n=1 Tax=Coleophoma cylindrospora TaxID=1849047 RepID=A0A3D8SR87_9HELO|nr:hypothetical protein BP6252_00839 [Coleophoma cylindrospora]